ncbi:MAG: GT4 family glycosyltransferase PelF [Candidatus Wallbacteria bacterium]|nr:GT4 family glycosyltransferase PelF [Candidatus Wallbacteria bacterium]
MSGEPLTAGSGPTEPTADVCLVLEGSYPYVRGGVSSWVHDLMTGLPDLKFSLMTLVATEADLKRAYTLPPNVVGLEEVVLAAPLEAPERPYRLPDGFLERVRRLHGLMESDPKEALTLLKQFLADPFCTGPANDGFLRALAGKEAWDLLLELYASRRMDDCSFNAYFYTFLNSHLRLFMALRARLLPARVYHAISTGYAGALAASSSLRSGRPLALTEHGLYTNERNLDITASEWLEGRPGRAGVVFSAALGKIRQTWMKLFEWMGRLTYDQARVVTTLFEGNRRMQIEAGAEPGRTRVIPNGVDFEGLSALPRTADPAAPVVALVGRVVPIKDLRTFIKACALAARRLPGASFEVLGPYEEDPIYHAACVELVRELGIESRFHFRGHVNLREHFPRMTLCVLTSMSEGLPLVMLESMACGVPNVATRVGACEELLLGRTRQDRALGPAGIATGVSAPEETAEAIVRLLSDQELYGAMARSARKRVELYYTRTDVLAQYRRLYEELVGASEPVAPGPPSARAPLDSAPGSAG